MKRTIPTLLVLTALLAIGAAVISTPSKSQLQQQAAIVENELDKLQQLIDSLPNDPPPPQVNQSPTAGFGVTKTDLSVAFTDTSTDPDGALASWGWEFGDGNTSAIQNPTHVYAVVGSYEVTLRVVDNEGGLGAIKQTVTVAQVPPPSDHDHGTPNFESVADLIVIDGATVTLPETTEIVVVRDGGVLVQSADATLTTLHVHPGGRLVQRAGTLTIRDAPFHEIDTLQRGNGLIVSGDWHCSGTHRDAYVQCQTPLTIGQSIVSVVSIPVGWKVGQEILVPDTAQRPAFTAYTLEKHEVRRIVAIGDDTITLDRPLQYEHPSAQPNEESLSGHPFLFNLDGDVRIKSENPLGNRGHVSIQGHGHVEIRGLVLEHLGRTPNVQQPTATEIGLYPIHFHRPEHGEHMGGLHADSVVVKGFRKWAYAIHGVLGTPQTHRLSHCVGALGEGACLAFEDGHERGVLVDTCAFGGTTKLHRTHSSFGTGGDGIWSRSAGSAEIRNTVVSGVGGYGFNRDGYGVKFIPPPPLPFEDNVAIACQGAAIWSTHSQGQQSKARYLPQIIERFRSWNCVALMVAYHEGKLFLNDVVHVGDHTVVNRGNRNTNIHSSPWSYGVALYGYETFDSELRNVYLQGANVGLIVETLLGPEGLTLENVRLRNHVNLLTRPSAFGSGAIHGAATHVGLLANPGSLSGDFPVPRPIPSEPTREVQITATGRIIVE